MGQFRDFEEINAWQEARSLLKNIRVICKRPAAARDYTFVDQITRASRSISANIAEGNDALTHNEFIKYLGIAKRSAAEVRSHLYDAHDEGYISESEFNNFSMHTRKITRMLAKLIHHLQQINSGYRRTYTRQANEPINKRTNEQKTG